MTPRNSSFFEKRGVPVTQISTNHSRIFNGKRCIVETDQELVSRWPVLSWLHKNLSTPPLPMYHFLLICTTSYYLSAPLVSMYLHHQFPLICTTSFPKTYLHQPNYNKIWNSQSRCLGIALFFSGSKTSLAATVNEESKINFIFTFFTFQKYPRVEIKWPNACAPPTTAAAPTFPSQDPILFVSIQFTLQYQCWSPPNYELRDTATPQLTTALDTTQPTPDLVIIKSTCQSSLSSGVFFNAF